MKHYIWQPGAGCDSTALLHMRSRFGRPAKVMGEAWFMSEERRMYNELAGDLNSLSSRQLQQVLEEIASGTSSFGPLQEWHDWYHYLLPQLVPRGHEQFVSSLLESLITAFCALYPSGVHRPPYPEFRDDALNTLGRCLMDPRCWNGNEIVVGTFLHRSNNNPNKVWCWFDASGDFSASLYFCLKYLPPTLVRDWFSSVLTIESAHWRAQVLVWLVGSHDLLQGRIHWPSEFGLDATPYVGWEWSHCLKRELTTSDESGAAPVESFLPSLTRETVLEVAHGYFTEDTYLAWLESISSAPEVEGELGAISSTFEHWYVGR